MTPLLEVSHVCYAYHTLSGETTALTHLLRRRGRVSRDRRPQRLRKEYAVIPSLRADPRRAGNHPAQPVASEQTSDKHRLYAAKRPSV